jgi:ribokinase
VPCVLNPAPPVGAVLRSLVHRPLLTPNRGELAALLGMLAERNGGASPGAAVHSDDAEAQARALSDAVRAPVVVTLGGDGALLVADGETRHVEALEVDVRDATGAGDTFNGVLAATLAAGATLAEAVARARTAASLSVGAVGARTGMPDGAQIAGASAS